MKRNDVNHDPLFCYKESGTLNVILIDNAFYHTYLCGNLVRMNEICLYLDEYIDCCDNLDQKRVNDLHHHHYYHDACFFYYGGFCCNHLSNLIHKSNYGGDGHCLFFSNACCYCVDPARTGIKLEQSI